MQAMSSTEAWYEMRCWNIDLGAQSLNFQHFASDLLMRCSFENHLLDKKRSKA